MAQSGSSFVNQVWSFDEAQAITNQYSKVGMEIYIFKNGNYDSYADFLSSAEATSKVDEGVDHLKQSVLTSFRQVVPSYDSYIFRVKLTANIGLSVNNQALGFCVG